MFEVLVEFSFEQIHQKASDKVRGMDGDKEINRHIENEGNVSQRREIEENRMMKTAGTA